MIAFISLIYASFYFIVFGKGLVKKNARNISIFTCTGIVLVGIIVFMWLTFAPTTKDGRTFQYVVQIVPNVAGPVTEVTADALVPLKEGDILFKIDPTQYQASVDQLEASIKRTEAQKQLADTFRLNVLRVWSNAQQDHSRNSIPGWLHVMRPSQVLPVSKLSWTTPAGSWNTR